MGPLCDLHGPTFKFPLEGKSNPCQAGIMDRTIYKIVTRAQWLEAERNGVFDGAPVDHAGGYIHFSTGHQVRKTVALHFTGQDELLLIAVSVDKLGKKLKWEPSRGGDLFPHLYDKLSLDAVTNVAALTLDPNGNHEFPPEIPA